MSYTLPQLNQMDCAAFTAALGAVFEDTPVIATRAWDYRSFHSVAQLHSVMLGVVASLSPAEKMALICAHPSLGDRVKMAEASVLEQSSLGLDCLMPDEYNRFQTLNRAYRDKFGFPFIIAVRNHSKASILVAFEQRLQNSIAMELQQALVEIGQIAGFRLQDLILIE